MYEMKKCEHISKEPIHRLVLTNLSEIVNSLNKREERISLSSKICNSGVISLNMTELIEILKNYGR